MLVGEDIKALEELRAAILDDICKANDQIARVKQAMREGDASVERGLEYLGAWQEGRDRSIYALSEIEARMGLDADRRWDRADSVQGRDDEMQWLARTPKQSTTPHHEIDANGTRERDDWWNAQAARTQEKPWRDPARAEKVERALPEPINNEPEHVDGDAWWRTDASVRAASYIGTPEIDDRTRRNTQEWEDRRREIEERERRG